MTAIALILFTSMLTSDLKPIATLDLWPGVAPGDVAGEIGAEHDAGPHDGVIRLANVTKPTIQVFKPERSKDTGAAVVVCPGGGYQILAMNLEGTEICSWLNSVGVTAILLKYRVPSRDGLPPYAAALQDAQRALGLARSHAKDWNIDPHRLGILGFSAGGHLSAATSTNYRTRSYAPIDEADQLSCRPDFAILIYPAYLTSPDLTHLAADLPVDGQTPPTIIVQTEDDPIHVENATVYAQNLKAKAIPVELHVYAKGGHGYGLRPSQNPVSHWPALVEDWMKNSGFLNRS
jgi:acetyl esterase/lipase